MGAIINRYELISLIISSNFLLESDREFIAKTDDKTLFKVYARKQFKEFRKGYYILN